jgi:hypothetical protein
VWFLGVRFHRNPQRALDMRMTVRVHESIMSIPYPRRGSPALALAWTELRLGLCC